jgi:hypothetical protein
MAALIDSGNLGQTEMISEKTSSRRTVVVSQPLERGILAVQDADLSDERPRVGRLKLIEQTDAAPIRGAVADDPHNCDVARSPPWPRYATIKRAAGCLRDGTRIISDSSIFKVKGENADYGDTDEG